MPRPAKNAVRVAAAAGAVAPRNTENRRIQRTSYASAAAPDRKKSEWSARPWDLRTRRRSYSGAPSASRGLLLLAQHPIDQFLQLRFVRGAGNPRGDPVLRIEN